ncbi:MAG TPA: AAA family ATPase [Solirubrobacteraceae bacterium]|jgi:DNA-binding CsgD family transcriptional regulator|nr:AAA family ATPase [Solirubrobacteraceae bacterium]
MHTLAGTASAALLERELELERAHAALRAVGQRDGCVLVIEGAAGIGKSRLLESARARASQLGFRVLSARATELEQGFPFGIVRQLFERLVAEADEDERERWLAGAAGLAAEVLTGAPAAAPSPGPGPASADPAYAWQHGLYWLASNLSSDAPLVLAVDDLQWIDRPSARALAFIARRLEGQPLTLVLATRPLDPEATPVSATLLADPGTHVLRPSPLTRAAVGAMVAERLGAEPHDRFVAACLDVTGGNPFLVGELLEEAAACGLAPNSAAAGELSALVPRGVANTVLLRLSRQPPAAVSLARAVSVLGDRALVGDAGRLAELAGPELEAAMASLVSAGILESGGTVRFIHPILRTAVYGDLSPAHRERLHRDASRVLAERGAPSLQVAAQAMQTDPAANPQTVALLREAAREALVLGDAVGAAALLARALAEPPPLGHRAAVVLELGQAHARAGAPEAVAPLSEIVNEARDPGMIAAAAIELSGMLFFAGRADEGAAILDRAHGRLPPAGPAREQLEVALLGVSYTSAWARRAAQATIDGLKDPGGPAGSVLEATALATLAMDEMMYLRSAARAADCAHRAIAAGLPPEPQRGEAWAIVALAVLAATDELDEALRGADEIVARARELGAAAAVATILALRAFILTRRGDLLAAQADAQSSIELATDLLGVEFVVLAVSASVIAGLEREETTDSLRRLIDRVGIRYDTEFSPSSQLRYASALLRAAAGNPEGAIEELMACELDHPALGALNPAVLPWRSAAALLLADVGRHEEARGLAADELRRAETFGAPRAIAVALRADALVGPSSDRAERLKRALELLEPLPARLEQARVLIDLGATYRAAGKRSAARAPLLDGLALASRCGGLALERRARAELAAIGIRPRTTGRSGAESLTPSERRVSELAAAGQTNREIAQTLFVTEKTVETHLGRAFRKLDVTSRRQLPDVLVRTSG